MSKNILNMEEFLLEAKTSAEKIQELKEKMRKRSNRIANYDPSEWKKKRKLEIRNKIDYYKIKIERYRDYINNQLS